jgi:hypothetical protein
MPPPRPVRASQRYRAYPTQKYFIPWRLYWTVLVGMLCAKVWLMARYEELKDRAEWQQVTYTDWIDRNGVLCMQLYFGDTPSVDLECFMNYNRSKTWPLVSSDVSRYYLGKYMWINETDDGLARIRSPAGIVSCFLQNLIMTAMICVHIGLGVVLKVDYSHPGTESSPLVLALAEIIELDEQLGNDHGQRKLDMPHPMWSMPSDELEDLRLRRPDLDIAIITDATDPLQCVFQWTRRSKEWHIGTDGVIRPKTQLPPEYYVNGSEKRPSQAGAK